MRDHQRGWTASDCEKLKVLVQQGASAFRAAAALRRSVSAIKYKARELGCPFARMQGVRAKTKAILEGRAEP
jgi:hypothetical protein